MALEVCPKCTCQFAVGLLHCPQCGEVAPLFADHPTEENPMPRITVAGGPSNAAAAPGEPGYVEPPAEAPVVAVSDQPASEPVDTTSVETAVPAEAPAVQQAAEPTTVVKVKAQSADTAQQAPAAPAGDTGGA